MELHGKIIELVKSKTGENQPLNFLKTILSSSLISPKEFPAFIADENKFPFEQLGQKKSVGFQNQSCDLYFMESVKGGFGDINEQEINRVKDALKENAEKIMKEIIDASAAWAGIGIVSFGSGDIEFVTIGENCCAIMIVEASAKVKKVFN